MFIYNVKINGSKVFKYFFTGVIILIICILCIVLFRIFSGAGKANNSSCLPQNDVFEISSKNYTNVLKTVHENIDTYVGMKIKFTGYVYRVSDLTDNQFVLARDMIVSSNYQSVIVGFLCECDNAKDFDDEVWVQVTGEITKGNYHGDMPILNVQEIQKVDAPSEEYVYPPDEDYVPTSSGL